MEQAGRQSGRQVDNRSNSYVYIFLVYCTLKVFFLLLKKETLLFCFEKIELEFN